MTFIHHERYYLDCVVFISFIYLIIILLRIKNIDFIYSLYFLRSIFINMYEVLHCICMPLYIASLCINYILIFQCYCKIHAVPMFLFLRLVRMLT